MLKKISQIIELNEHVFKLKINQDSTIHAALKEWKISKKHINTLCQGLQIKVTKGQILSFSLKQEDIHLKQSQEHVEILYEDSLCLIAYKKPFLLVHDDGNNHTNLQDQIQSQIQWSHSIQCVHRIDEQTSGLVLFCKQPIFQPLLDDIIANHKMIKEYECVVVGHFPWKEKEVYAPISQDRHRNAMRISSKGKDASTFITCLKGCDDYSLLKVRIQTGRKHQIRVHLAHLGYPIVNDQLYGEKENDQGLYLQCHHLKFTHPITHEIIDIYAPKDLRWKSMWE